ncbi:hypothetical protein I9Y31_000052 [Clostridium perfringens]|nr:hypothetical protein [Clostridium perfringens]
MFQYTFTNGDFKINTPFCKDFSQVKNKIISQSAECIHSISEYPNGFVIESLQYADKVVLKTNKDLIVNDDGSIDVQI